MSIYMTVDDIQDDLERRIDLLGGDDALPPGKKLPAQAALAEHYRVPTATVNRAIRRLVTAGLIRTTPGSGSWVRSEARDHKPVGRRGAVVVTDLVTDPGPDQGRCTIEIDLEPARGNYPSLWMDVFRPIFTTRFEETRRSVADILAMPLDMRGFAAAAAGVTRLTVITDEILIEDIVEVVDAAITQANADVEPVWRARRAFASRSRRIADRRLARATPRDYWQNIDNRVRELTPSHDN